MAGKNNMFPSAAENNSSARRGRGGVLPGRGGTPRGAARGISLGVHAEEALYKVLASQGDLPEDLRKQTQRGRLHPQVAQMLAMRSQGKFEVMDRAIKTETTAQSVEALQAAIITLESEKDSPDPFRPLQQLRTTPEDGDLQR